MKCKSANYNEQLSQDEVFILPFLVGLLINTFYFTVANSTLTVKTGYAWDGLSIPFQKFVFRIWWFGPWLRRTTLIASLLHDVLYQIMRLNLVENHKRFKLKSDKALRVYSYSGGCWVLLCWLIYIGVRVGGNPYTEPRSEPREHEFNLVRPVGEI